MTRTASFPQKLLEDRLTAVPHEATWLGVRVSALAEIVLFLALALALDAMLFQGERFWAVAPHPFWIIVVLASVQYGTPVGLLAAGLASVSLLAFNLPPQPSGQDLYEYLFLLVQRPSLWVLAAVVLGELRMRQLGERNDLRAALMASKDRERDLHLAYTQVQRQNEQLERRLAAQPRTVSSVLHDIIEIQSAEPDALWGRYADLCQRWLNAGRCSVYRRDQAALVLTVQRGWTDDQAPGRTLSADSPLYQAVVVQRRSLCVTDPKDEAVLSGQGLMAAPLVHPRTDEIFGMLKVESLGLLDLNVSTLGTFKALSSWGGLIGACIPQQGHGAPLRAERTVHALPVSHPVLRRSGAAE